MAYISLANNILESLAAEASRHAPRETGGVLLGQLTGPDDGRLVTHWVGPGPKAVHSRDRFVPDHDFQEAEIRRLYERSGRRLQYLGDWHTHPGYRASLSDKDTRTLEIIARCEPARISRPVMLILAPGPEWKPHAWVGAVLQKGRVQKFTIVIAEVRLIH